ncbi:MAG: sulfatase [Armatimonadetes bacterium]|nr:sulfatase [Armatimonadota bacterium]
MGPAAWLGAASPEERHRLSRPNILLINCDDLGYGDIGCYGSKVHGTPAIDRMAAEGVRFTDFYMAAACCSPSRAAMMTGCRPQRIGLQAGHKAGVLEPCDPIGLSPDEITVADLLKRQGYATKIIGKWHCGDQPPFLPTRHGFDSYYGLPYSNDMRMTRNFPDTPPLPLLRDEEVVEAEPNQASLTERYTEEAVRFLRQHREGPFLLYFAHMYVHGPIQVPQRFLSRSRDEHYGAAVEHIDFVAAALFHELKRLGLDESTLVVFTSDNGANRKRADFGSNLPLLGYKGSSWEGGHRVPCIMRWPGRIPAGSVCPEVATAMDFLPTFTRLAGGEPPTDRIIDGKDIRSLMTGEPGAKSPYDAHFYYHANTLCAIRMGDWKLHLTAPKVPNGPGGEKRDLHPDMLFNLREDIGETTDAAQKHPDVVARLKARADICRRDLGDQATGARGENRRPAGRVDDPKPLTRYDPAQPYMHDPFLAAAYD